MWRAELILSQILILLILGGLVTPIVTQRNHWPFSKNAMYAKAKFDPHLIWLVLEGTNSKGDVLYFLNACEDCFPEAAHMAIEKILVSGLRKGLGETKYYLKKILQRSRKVLSNPELHAIRLYKVSYDLRSTHDPRNPSEKIFLMEVQL